MFILVMFAFEFSEYNAFAYHWGSRPAQNLK
jgi:hypothetical protein